ncbi:MAG TPA: hypothetical protein DEH25_12630 [Chloroflexi bacterium]|nr:hypothetical protein [Chloroflexota bacterium]
MGLGAAWKHNRGLGLLPLWISLIYALGNALVRSSGWRFNLPVDWVGLFYYGLGLVQIITWGAMFFANRLLPDETQPKLTPTAQISFPWGQTLVLGGLLFLVSAAIPISEALIPARYPAGWLAQTLDDPLLQAQLNQAGISEALPDFAAQTGSELIYGRALYPRFYSAGQGIPGQAWFAFVPREYTRLGFYLVGPHSQNVVLPLGDAPANFPHAADVIVLGCLRDEYLEAQLVILRGETDTVLFDSSQFDWGCK